MANSSLSASLTVRMIDDVSKPARSVAQALKDAGEAARNVAKGMAGTGATDRFVASLAKLKASKSDIEQVASAWKDYAKSAALAADASTWTKSQVSGVKAWERQTISSLRQVEGEQKRFFAAQQRAQSRGPSGPGGGVSGSALGGAVGLYGLSKAEQFASSTLSTYRDFSDVNAIMRPVLDLSPAEQASLKAQQMRLGVESRYDAIKVAEAQKMLGERGVDKRIIQPYVDEAVNYASAMNVELPDAIKTLEAYSFSTGKLKGVTDPGKARDIIRRATDYATHLGKISGLSNDEISDFFEYGGLSGHQAGLSDETVGAMAAIMKRNQISGEKAGVAMRAISAKLVSPTGKGLTALNAIGIDYDKFTKMPGGISGGNISLAVQRSLGKKLTRSQIDRLNDLSDVKDEAGNPLVTDRGAYIAAAAEIVGETFAKNKKGELYAKDAHDIANTVGSVYKASVEGVDTEGLINAIANAHATLAQLNAIFGFQQGSRAGAALTDPEELDAYRKKLADTPAGFALDIATERLKSFAGALSQLEGSITTLKLRVGESFDDHGSGKGPLSTATQAMTGGVNWLIGLPDAAQRLITEGAAYAGLIGTLRTIGAIAGVTGLSGTAGALRAVSGFLGPVGWLLTASSLAYEGTSAMERARLTPKEAGKSYTSDVLLGVSNALNRLFGGNGDVGKPYDADAAADEYMKRAAAAPAKDASSVGDAKTAAEGAKTALGELNATVKPQVDASSIEQAHEALLSFLADLSKAGVLARALPGSFSGARASIPSLGKTSRGAFSTGGVGGAF